MKSKTNFSQLAKLGKNDWWRYLAGLIVFLISCIIANLSIVIVQYIFLRRYNNLPNESLLYFAKIHENNVDLFNIYLQKIPIYLITFCQLFPYTITLASLFIIVKCIHKRNFITLLTPKKELDYFRVFHGVIIYFCILILINAVRYLPEPNIVINTSFNLITYLISLFFVLLFLPFQTLTEDLLFRGYILQYLGLRIKNIWSLSITTGFLFAFIHLANPEIDSYGQWLILSGYVLPGIFLTLIALKDNRLELSLGIHFANNLFTTLVVSSKITALPSETLFTYAQNQPASLASCLSTLTKFGLFYFYFFIIKKNLSKECT